MNIVITFIKKYFVVSVTILAGLVYLINLGQKDLGLDEISSFVFTQNWQHFLHILHYQEGNMWLYYFILFFWDKLGSSEAWLRLPSVIFATATIPYFYLLAKKVTGEYTGKIATILLVLNLFVVQNAQNVRSYSLLLLLTTMSSYFFISYVFKPSKKFLLVIIAINILSIYSHLYAAFVIATQLLALLLLNPRKYWKECIVMSVGTGLFCLPYLFVPSLHSGQIDWISKPDVRQLIKTYIILANDFLPLTVISSFLFFWQIMVLWKKQVQLRQNINTWMYEFIFLWIILPIVAAYLFSLIVKPLYLPMYFIIIVAPFTILLAHAINSITNEKLKTAIILCFISLSLIRLCGWYAQDTRLNFVISNKNEEWKKVDEVLAANAKAHDAIISFPSFVLDYSDLYAKKDKVTINQLDEIRFLPNRVVVGDLKNSTPFNKVALEKIPKTHQTVWYIYGNYENPKIAYQKTLIENMLKENYVLRKTYVFSILTLYEYKKIQ